MLKAHNQRAWESSSHLNRNTAREDHQEGTEFVGPRIQGLLHQNRAGGRQNGGDDAAPPPRQTIPFQPTTTIVPKTEERERPDPCDASRERSQK